MFQKPDEDPLKHYPGEPLTLDAVLFSLLHDGLLNEDDVKRIRSETSMKSQTVHLHPLVVIANEKVESRLHPGKQLTLETLTRWLAKKAGLSWKKIDSMKVEVEKVTQTVSHEYASRYRILPIEVDSEKVVFATAEPFVTRWIDDLGNILKKRIERVVANPLDVHRFLLEFYSVSRSMRLAENTREKGSNLLNFEQLLELGKATNLSADDQHIVHIVDWLLQFAFEQRSSDIHLEPRRDTGRVRFRIDGKLHDVYKMPSAVMTAVTSRIKILGRMDVAEKRKPQDGRIKTLTPEKQEIELRISTMPTAFGEKVVMRIFDPDVVVQDFSRLGFDFNEVQIWNEMVDRPHGIVLVTGPTGSGKTTTLYSTLKSLARPEINVCTVEDPIEMVAEEFNQMQVQPAIGVDFASGIRTLMRQDPDIIMIGEIRDLETAQMAIQASLTGHLVLSTLHTNDAPSAVTRLMDLGVPHYLLQGTLTGVVAQRLVRKLCPHCKREESVNKTAWESLVQPWKMAMPAKVGKPVGCLECRKTGFLGRTAIFEMLMLTPKMRSLIRPDVNLQTLKEAAITEGMRPLRLSAARQVAEGHTTIEEVLEVLPPVEF